MRSFMLALTICAAVAAIGAGSASAAANLQVTTDSNQSGSLTSVKIKTALTGSGTDLKQYGASFKLPPALNLRYYYFGDTSTMCPAGNFSVVNGGLTNVAAFTNAGCPAAAKIGTASLGSLTGSIYAVNASPLPAVGVYFDGGTSSPFGRKLNTSWAEDGSMTASIMGLPNSSSTGLELNFSNPGRAGGLSDKVFTWVEAGDPACVASSQVTGSVYNWPLVVLGTLFGYSTTTATPATLSLSGCDFGFITSQDTRTPGAQLGLSLFTGVYAPGTRQYGAAFDLPVNIWVNYSGYGGPNCSPASFSALSTGITPAVQAFTPTDCASGSIVGTASLGSQSGKIYLVGSSPLPQFGVWFDSGVAAPYGRRLSLDWGPEGYGRPQMRVFGLDGAANAGLNLSFTPPVAGQSKVFRLAPAGDEQCVTDYAKSTIYTYPTSGTKAVANGPVTARGPLQEIGC
ncbi:MAG: hypothetical protein QM648_07460 [Solirubrobacterales bacterium]